MDWFRERWEAVRRWMERLMYAKYMLPGIFLASFLETTIIPIPIELVLVPLMLNQRGRRPGVWTIATVTLAGCLVGVFLIYLIGYFAFDTAGLWFLRTFGYEQSYQSFRGTFNQHAFWVVLTVGVTPVPFQLAAITAGVSHYSPWLFLIASLIARGVRYWGLGALVQFFGYQAQGLIHKHKKTAMLVALGVLAVTWGAMKLLGM